MDRLVGIGISPGRAIGPVLRMPTRVSEPAEEQFRFSTSAEREVQRLHAASGTVSSSLLRRAGAAVADAAAILETTALMASDPTLLAAATSRITERHLSAERAAWEAASQFAETMKQLDGAMADRAADVLDVRARLVAALRGLPDPGVPQSATPFVLVADDLAPADAAVLNPSIVLGILTGTGGAHSHTAILARHLGVPAVAVAAGIERLQEGDILYLDGATGEVHLAPDASLRAAARHWKRRQAALPGFDGTGATADGHRVPLLANVGGPEDAAAAARAGAEGIGLLRTEFCFPGRRREPSVAEQVQRYRQVFDAFASKTVVVRTLDSGAGKSAPLRDGVPERNPALGLRGFRTGALSPEVLRRQLQAIAAAAEDSSARVCVMAPMIATGGEAAAFSELCRRAGLSRTGVMVEIPAAALSARSLLREVDFVSVGTNDLAQYTMAADRQLGALAALNDPWQPAVLELINLTVAAAKSADKPVSICGEAAADPALAVVLVGLGVSSLSMTARALPAVAAVLKSVSRGEAQTIARAVLEAESAAAARTAARAALPILERLGL